MGVIKGDFLGFTFNGIHSSELGIFRVSDGSRYTENLLPTIQDKTTPRPGADGTYYYGSFYTQKPFNVSIAYDNLSEEQLRKIKQVFSDKNPRDLIFDEAPYKVYKVKITGTPNLKYVCFDKEKGKKISLNSSVYEPGSEINAERVYKGEGQLSFIGYEPFARSRFKYLDEYTLENIPEWGPLTDESAVYVHDNFYEWEAASRMKYSGTIKDEFILDKVENNGFMYYNAGDEPVPFLLYMETGGKGFTIRDESENNFLTIGDFILYEGDSKIRINTRLHLIEGIDENNKPTGTIYNKYITGGDFFKLPVTEDLTRMHITWTEAPTLFNGFIEYKYLYY